MQKFLLIMLFLLGSLQQAFTKESCKVYTASTISSWPIRAAVEALESLKDLGYDVSPNISREEADFELIFSTKYLCSSCDRSSHLHFRKLKKVSNFIIAEQMLHTRAFGRHWAGRDQAAATRRMARKIKSNLEHCLYLP